MRVLDTAALLHWPVEQITGNICSQSQQAELERVSPQRWMLIQSIDIEWRDVPPAWLSLASEAAVVSGDLPRLSDVDIDVLALALGMQCPLVTDDYRLQNVMKSVDQVTHTVGAAGAKQVWKWELKCTGCRATSEVPKNVNRSRGGDVGDCDRCGSPLKLKRRK